MDNNGIQATPNLVRAILAPILQPGAQLGLTGQETQTSQQSQQTGQAEQANLQASNPGIQAQSSTQQIENLQKKAQLGLTADLHNGMTLGSAMNKYKALGMSADDIFNQYVSQSKYGFPKESPVELHNMGVSEKAIGQPGQAYTPADRYNTRSALNELQTMQNIWNNTSFSDRVAGEAGMSDNVRKYNQSQTIVGEHLSSLIPGGSNASGSVDQLINALPNIGDLRISKEAGNQLFEQAKTLLMQQKGYTPKDLGLPTSNQQGQPQQAKGSHLLNTILNQANGNPPPSNNGQGGDLRQGAIDVLQGNLKQAVTDTYGNNPAAIVNNVLGSQKDVGVGGFNNALAATVGGEAITTGALKVLEPILGKTVTSAAGNVERLPGAVKSVMRTGAAMGQTGDVRGKMLQDATKQGVKISGNDIIDNLNTWARQKMLGSSDPKDIQAVKDALSIAKKQYAGKTFDPSDLKGIYDNVTKAFTKGGDLKAPIQAELDNAKKQAFDKVLGSKVPGWNQATQKFSQLYNIEGSTGKKVAKTVATNGASYLLALLGLHGAENLLSGL